MCIRQPKSNQDSSCVSHSWGQLVLTVATHLIVHITSPCKSDGARESVQHDNNNSYLLRHLLNCSRVQIRHACSRRGYSRILGCAWSLAGRTDDDMSKDNSILMLRWCTHWSIIRINVPATIWSQSHFSNLQATAALNSLSILTLSSSLR